MTHLEAWRANAEDQRLSDAFFKSDTGQRWLATMREMNAPRNSTAKGLDGIYEDSRGMCEWKGWNACMDAMKGLSFYAIQPVKNRESAFEELLKQDKDRRNLFSSPPQ